MKHKFDVFNEFVFFLRNRKIDSKPLTQSHLNPIVFWTRKTTPHILSYSVYNFCNTTSTKQFYFASKEKF